MLSKKGAGLEPALKTNLGVKAQALRHMDIIARNTIEVDFFNMRVTVPTPEAYTVHKIVINQERGQKQEKDQLAIKNIWPLLNQKSVSEIVKMLTKKEQKAFEQFCVEHLG